MNGPLSTEVVIVRFAADLNALLEKHGMTMGVDVESRLINVWTHLPGGNTIKDRWGLDYEGETWRLAPLPAGSTKAMLDREGKTFAASTAE